MVGHKYNLFEYTVSIFPGSIIRPTISFTHQFENKNDELSSLLEQARKACTKLLVQGMQLYAPVINDVDIMDINDINVKKLTKKECVNLLLNIKKKELKKLIGTQQTEENEDIDLQQTRKKRTKKKKKNKRKKRKRRRTRKKDDTHGPKHKRRRKGK